MSSRDLATTSSGVREPHTPGPWYVKPSRVSANLCIYSGAVGDEIGGYGIGEAWNLNYNPENAANARLIAAAPDLLEALIQMEAEKADYMRINKLGDPAKEHTNKLARAAIAKAVQS